MQTVVPPTLARSLPQIESWQQRGPSSFLGIDSGRAGQAIEVRVCPPSDSRRALQFAALTAGEGAQRLQAVVQSGLLPDGGAFLVLAHHPHGSLAERLARALDELSALRLAEALAAAVASLHQARFAHLDLRPERVVYRGPDAAVLAPPGPLSADSWAAPELQAGLPLDFQARVRLDIYGLASLLHACLLGKPPRPGRPEVFQLEGAGVSRETQQLLLRALARDAAQRPSSMRQLRAALRDRLRDLGATLQTEEPTAGDESALGRCGPYQLLEELARGGMGVVYRAYDPRLQTHVALKRMLFAPRGHQTERFLREARTLARLRHPGIVTVHEVDFDQGAPYMVMDLVAGGSLQTRLREGPLPLGQAMDIATRVAQAMHYAHGEGVVHRDLKPANILLGSEGQPLVSDFGLALVQDGQSGLTDAGALLGTLPYMPPEQASGEREALGAWTDVYAIGAVLYQLVTGQRPFSAQSSLELLRLIREQDPTPPARLRPDLPADVSAIIVRCLEKEPARRYPSAAALAADIERFRVGLPVEARPVGGLERVWRRVRRHKAVSALSGALVLLALGFLVFHLIRIEAKNEEIQQRWRIAERRGAIAESTLVSLGEDVQGWLRFEQGDSRAQRVAERMLHVAIDGWEQLAEVAGEQDGISARAARARCNLGYLLLASHGERERALALFAQAAAELELVFARSPSLPVALEYARVLEAIGNEQCYLDLPRARDSLLRAVELSRVAEPLAGDERPRWLGALAGHLSSLARTERQLSGLTTALALQSEALACVREAVGLAGQDPALQGVLWRVLYQQAGLLRRAGRGESSRAHAQEALHLARRMRATQPQDMQMELRLGMSLQQLSTLARDRGTRAEALAAAGEAVELSRTRLARDSSHVAAREHMAIAWLQLAASSQGAQQLEALAGARALMTDLLAHFPDRPERLARRTGAVAELAEALAEDGGPASTRALREQVEAQRLLQAALPASADARHDLAKVLIGQADHLRHVAGDVAAGLAAADEAWNLLTGLHAHDSLDVLVRSSLAACAHTRSVLQSQRGDLRRAQANAARAVELSLQLQSGDSAALALRVAVASAASNLVHCLVRQGQAAAALEVVQRVEPQVASLPIAALPPASQAHVARWYGVQSEARLQGGALPAAHAAAARGVELLRQACAADTASLALRYDLCGGLARLALAAEALGSQAEALAWRQESHALSQQAARAHPDRARWQLRLASDLAALARSWSRLARPEDELACSQQAVEVVAQLVARDSTNIVWLQDLASFTSNLGRAHYRQGAFEAAVRCFEQGVRLSEQLCAQVPEHVVWWDLRAHHHQNLVLGLTAQQADPAALEPARRRLLAAVGAVLQRRPEDTVWLATSSNHSWDLAEAARRRDDPAELEHLQAALQARMQLVELCHETARHHRTRARLLQEQTEHHLRFSAPQAALSSAESAVVAAETLVELEPGQSLWQLELARRRAELARVLAVTGEQAAAEELHEQIFASVAETPVPEDDAQSWVLTLAYCEALRSELRMQRGERDQAFQSVKATRDALQQMREQGEVGPEWWTAAARTFLLSGRLLLLEGDAENALRHIFKAAQLDPGLEGACLWLAALSGSRAPLAELPVVPVPEPLLQFLVGEISAQELLAGCEARSDQGARQRELGVAHTCIALQSERAEDLEAARAHYQAALETGFCEPGLSGWARVRLEQLLGDAP